MTTHTPAPAFSRRALLRTGIALAAWPALGSSSAHANTWPTQNVRIVVGFPGGSSPDLTARTFADPLAQLLGRAVIVENKVGAGGNIGAAEVAHAKDGHTIGLMINGNMTIAKILNPRAGYDPATDLAPLSLVGISPLVLAAGVGVGELPAGAGAQAFFAAARKAGATWNYGSPGIGTMGHLGMELLKARSGMSTVHIPYASYAQVVLAITRGELHMALLPPALAHAQAQSGKLRMLGVTSLGRSPLLPDVPSLFEAGMGEIDLQIWNAFAAPQSMPVPLRAQLSGKLIRIARQPDVRQKLFQQGWQVVAASPEGLANRIRRDTQELGKLIHERGITLG